MHVACRHTLTTCVSLTQHCLSFISHIVLHLARFNTGQAAINAFFGQGLGPPPSSPSSPPPPSLPPPPPPPPPPHLHPPPLPLPFTTPSAPPLHPPSLPSPLHPSSQMPHHFPLPPSSPSIQFLSVVIKSCVWWVELRAVKAQYRCVCLMAGQQCVYVYCHWFYGFVHLSCPPPLPIPPVLLVSLYYV